MSDGPAIELAIEDGVAIATMMRPKQRNPFSADFLACMADIITECGRNDEIKALILTGTEGVFCAGGDIKGMVERAQKGDFPAEDIRARLYDIHDWIQPLRNLSIPVICAVDGPAYGGGFGLALCADFILASENASFCSVFCRIGAIPDCGVLFTLPRMVGIQRAKEMMYTGRPIDAREAKDIGIAMDVYPTGTVLAEAKALARRMQDASGAAFAITKRIANQTFDNDAMTHVEMEAAGQSICLSSEYHKDAVNRFVEKQPLRFNWEAREAAE